MEWVVMEAVDTWWCGDAVHMWMQMQRYCRSTPEGGRLGKLGLWVRRWFALWYCSTWAVAQVW